MRPLILTLCGSVLFATYLSAQECSEIGAPAEVVDEFRYSVSSTAGGEGEIVMVDISLRIDGLRPAPLIGYAIVGCYDAGMLGPGGGPQYPDQFFELSHSQTYFPLGGANGPQRPDGGAGFVLFGNFQFAARDYFTSNESIHVASLPFRVRGTAGQIAEIRLCDGEFRYPDGDVCLNSLLVYNTPAPDGSSLDLEIAASAHDPGEVTILSPETTVLGDVDFDGEISLTDPLVLVNSLFLEGPIACPAASDFNEDDRVDLGDAVSILNYLFLEGPAANGEVRC